MAVEFEVTLDDTPGSLARLGGALGDHVEMSGRCVRRPAREEPAAREAVLAVEVVSEAGEGEEFRSKVKS